MIGYQISRKGNNGRKSEENYGKQPLTNIEKVVIVTHRLCQNLSMEYGTGLGSFCGDFIYVCLCLLYANSKKQPHVQ